MAPLNSKNRQMSLVQRVRKTQTAGFVFVAFTLAVSVSSASADTISGAELQSLSYTTSGAAFNGNSPTSAYVPSGGGYANLYTPDGNISTDLAAVSVNNGFNGISLGTLNTFIAAGAAGQVSFDLLSVPIASGQAPFWQITLADPKNSSMTMTFDTINAAPDKSGGQPIIGANYFNLSGYSSTMATTSTGQGNIPFLWSTIASTVSEDGSLLGTWQVSSVGVEIGGWNTTAPLDVEIDSITLPAGSSGSGGGASSIPDATSTLPLLGIGLGALAALRRSLRRGCF